MFARDVQVEDQDCYMCQINTERMKKQVSLTRVSRVTCHVSSPGGLRDGARAPRH